MTMCTVLNGPADPGVFVLDVHDGRFAGRSFTVEAFGPLSAYERAIAHCAELGASGVLGITGPGDTVVAFATITRGKPEDWWWPDCVVSPAFPSEYLEAM